MAGDLEIILRSYLITFLWQLIAWPFVRKYFNKLPDKGWAIGRLATTLTISLVIWNAAYLKLPANTNLGLIITTLILAVVSFVYGMKNTVKTKKTREMIKLIVLEEYLFLTGFVLMALVRGFAPDIHNLEKFMDYGFIKRYLGSPTLPAEDMWMAGQSINYYSFGHFWSSIVIRFFGVDPAVGYNLVLALLAGLGLQISFWVITILTAAKERARTIGGLIGSMAVMVGGNSHTIWYLLSHHGLKGYWYADATRFIYHTIHEFPSYSLVVSDLHGHLIDLPVVLFFIGLFAVWAKERKVKYEIVMGILFGVMMMTNTWDVAVYGLLLTVFGISRVIKDRNEIGKLFKSALIMLITMMAVAGFWWIQFNSISQGIQMVKERSPLWQLAVLWTGGVTATILAWVMSNRGPKKMIMGIILITVILLLLIPELVYAKDIYPNHPRANTMFKLTYQAFIMMALSLGVAAGQAAGGWKNKTRARIIGGLIITIIFTSVMIFPVEAFGSYYNDFRNYIGLNGEKWMETTMPGKYRAILYLRDHDNGRRMVEAVGDSYTDFNAVSVFSGIPTVLGWRVHEWLWRGGYEQVSIRDEEVRNIYEGSNPDEIRRILNKYGVGWILIGPDEREKYQVHERMLQSLGNIPWRGDGIYLIKVTY